MADLSNLQKWEILAVPMGELLTRLIQVSIVEPEPNYFWWSSRNSRLAPANCGLGGRMREALQINIALWGMIACSVIKMAHLAF